MDMMHSVAFAVPPKAPSGLTDTTLGSDNNKRIVLTWTGNSTNTTNFTVQRAVNINGPWNTLDNPLAPDVNSYTDLIGNSTIPYYYRVFASNTVGDTVTPGFPTVTVDSQPSNIVRIGEPSAPTDLTARQLSNLRVRLRWHDNSRNENGFLIERSENGSDFFIIAAVSGNDTTDIVSFIDRSVLPNNLYAYRIVAVNTAGFSAYSNTVEGFITL
jgi:hypothetical protein